MKTEKSWSNPDIFIPDNPDGRETVSKQIDDLRQTESLVGRVIANKYKVTDLVGQGGMALVYKAFLPDRRPVAIKTLKYRQSDLEARFALEIAIHSKLKHPNIVEPIEILKDPETGLSLFVMEYLEGLNLEDMLARFKRLNSVTDIATVFPQLLDALEFAHFNGFIHRDLKPENIIVVSNNGKHQLKILDFGLAKIEEDLQKLTKTGVVLGSPLYMSPEQCMGAELDTRSDLYSLGVLTYEIITGSPPYLSDDPMEIMKCHCSDRIMPPDMATYRPNLPEIDVLNQVIQKLLNTEKEKRHADIYELKEELADWWRYATNNDTAVETPFRLITDKNRARLEAKKQAQTMQEKIALDALVMNKIDTEKKSLKEKVDVSGRSRFNRVANLPVKKILLSIVGFVAFIGVCFLVVNLSKNLPQKAENSMPVKQDNVVKPISNDEQNKILKKKPELNPNERLVGPP